MQAQALRNIKPLPKRMLPGRLSLLKSVLRIFRPLGLQPALAGSGASRYSPSSQGYRPNDSFQPQLPDPTFEPPQTSAFLDDSALTSATATPSPSGIRIAGPQIGSSGSILLEPKDPEHGIWGFVEEDPPQPVPQIHPDDAIPEIIADPEAPMAFPPGDPLQQDVKAFVGEEAPAPDMQQQPLGRAREDKGLKPGQLDPNSMARKVEQRSKELRERRMYLKNFWYAAGERVF